MHSNKNSFGKFAKYYSVAFSKLSCNKKKIRVTGGWSQECMADVVFYVLYNCATAKFSGKNCEVFLDV